MTAERSSESFEEVYLELEGVVRVLEEGGLPLEESIAVFEQGMQLARRCKGMLDGAEARITTLVEEHLAAGVATPDGDGQC